MKRKVNIAAVGDDFYNYRDFLEDFFRREEISWKFYFAKNLKEIFRIVKERNIEIFLIFDSDENKRKKFFKFIRELGQKSPVIFLGVFNNLEKEASKNYEYILDLASSVKKYDLKNNLSKEELKNLKDDIKEALEKSGRFENKEGILITHGTDTLSWALAYLRYSLKGLKSNVAVTGSQIPLEGTLSPSDAVGNLRTAVYLLSKLKPPHLFAVFNNGKDVFSGRLTKFRKWDVDAFEGRLAAKVTHEGLKILRNDWKLIPYEDQKLEKLHFIKTGGTIESKRSKGKGLSPKGDFVYEYIKVNLKEHFEKILRYKVFSLDSSDLSFEDWKKIAKKIEDLGLAKCDSRFDKEVKPIFVNPLFTSKEYEKLFDMCGNGSILLGYGAGNANTLEKSSRSILTPLKKAVKEGKSVAVTSQVPLELYDTEYESGRKLIEAGGIPCGDLSFSDAQVKLSYLLGHKKIIESCSLSEKIDFELLLVSSFLSGVNLTKNQREELEKRFKKKSIGRMNFLSFDPFVSNSFSQAIYMVIKEIKGK